MAFPRPWSLIMGCSLVEWTLKTLQRPMSLSMSPAAQNSLKAMGKLNVPFRPSRIC
ncbi:hypothetical protein LDENG_00131910 [Lucifuga dentata]|nr:hypothetical protein LDENG_00131910 [Lucifuga dentata]